MLRQMHPGWDDLPAPFGGAVVWIPTRGVLALFLVARSHRWESVTDSAGLFSSSQSLEHMSMQGNTDRSVLYSVLLGMA